MELEFFTSGKTRVGYRYIDPVLLELITSLPSLTEPGNLSESAEKRFFPEPAQGEETEALRADWHAFVQPGLDELFRSTRDIVAADLKRVIDTKTGFEISIPYKHIEAWINVLNQARLALAADLGFDENLLGSSTPPDLDLDRALMLDRISLYEFMQMCLIESID
jgi:hypothetical protein